MAAAAVTGWYGPLIDLSSAAFHVGDFVQLLVLVRHCQPHRLQKFKAPNGGAIHKTLVQVGDNTLAYFSLSIANKYLGSTMHAGDIVLLQNVNLVKYGEVFEAVATQISSVQILLHSRQLVAVRDMDELITHCHVGITTREKLRKVVEWARQTESVLQNVKQKREQLAKNWKSQEENDSRNCTSVSEVLCLDESCDVNFLACISGIILQSRRPNEVVRSKLLLERRQLEKADNGLVEELICVGCKRCGCPVDSRSLLGEMKLPLYCHKSTNHLHTVCSIYRPLMLYIRDHSKHISLLVKNKAAEMLFGNVTAEDVYNCYEAIRMDNLCEQELWPNGSVPSCSQTPSGEETTKKSQRLECRGVAKHPDHRQKPDFYNIWLLLLKLLLHNENGPFKFEVSVDPEKDQENGRFELVSLTMPWYVADGT